MVVGPEGATAPDNVCFEFATPVCICYILTWKNKTGSPSTAIEEYVMFKRFSSYMLLYLIHRLFPFLWLHLLAVGGIFPSSQTNGFFFL